MKALLPAITFNNWRRAAVGCGDGAMMREATGPAVLRAQAVPAPDRPVVSVIIPALNEEKSIGAVLAAIPRAWPHALVDEVIVVDNGSADRTEMIARQHGARVVSQPERGYGAACLAGIAALKPETGIVVFLDADFSDYPEEIGLLIQPLVEWGADLALSTRMLDGASRSALTPQQRWGNWLAVTLIRWRYGFRYTDLGPFRAVRREALEKLGMRDRNYGWTVEMQIKALQADLRIVEVPLRYRVRIGRSKISGTLKGTLLAGAKILYTIGKYAFRRARLKNFLPPEITPRLAGYTRNGSGGSQGSQGDGEMRRQRLRMAATWRSELLRKSHRLALPLLILLLAASEAVWIVLLKFDAVNGARAVLTFLALLGSLFALFALSALVVSKLDNQRGALLVIAAGAVLFRLTMLPAGLPAQLSWPEKVGALRADVAGEAVAYERFLLYDHDIWRYLWDGHVAAHGINPFQFAPNDPQLDALTGAGNATLPAAIPDGGNVWGEIRDNVNHPAVPTIYPPLAQFVFRFAHAVAPGSVLVMKSLLTGFDLLAAVLLALTLRRLNQPATRVILYAWNPLVIKAFAASGHVDALLVAALAATAYFFAGGRRRVAAILFGLAVLAKLAPIVLLPLIVKRTGWRNAAWIAAVLLAGYAPFISAGRNIFTGLLTFARKWQFNAGPYALTEWVIGFFNRDPAMAARVVCGLAIIGVILFLAWRDDGRADSFASYATPALGALVVFSPTVMPWYVIWALPLAIVARFRVWVYFSALVCAAFQVMVDETERGWVLWLEYGLFALLCAIELRGVSSPTVREGLFSERPALPHGRAADTP